MRDINGKVERDLSARLFVFMFVQLKNILKKLILKIL